MERLAGYAARIIGPVIMIALLFTAAGCLRTVYADASDQGLYRSHLLGQNAEIVDLNLISLEDGNVVTAGSDQLTLGEGQNVGIAMATGSSLAATGRFVAVAPPGEDYLTVPDTFLGTDFIIPHLRHRHTYLLLSPDGPADVDITLDGQTASVHLEAGVLGTFDAGPDAQVAGVVQSSRPIVVAHVAQRFAADYEFYAVPPAAKNLWGMTGEDVVIGASEDDTTVQIIAEQGGRDTVSLNAGATYVIPAGAYPNQAMRLVADKPIAAYRSSERPADGAEPFLPRMALGSLYGFGLTTRTITVICPTDGTEIVVESGDDPPLVRTCSTAGDSPGRLTLSPSGVSGGATLRSDQPVLVLRAGALGYAEPELHGSGYRYHLLASSTLSWAVNLSDLDNGLRTLAGDSLASLEPHGLFSFDGADVGVGGGVLAGRPFAVGSFGLDTLWSPERLSATEFLAPRHLPGIRYKLLSPYADATVTVREGGASATVALPQGQVVDYTPSPAGEAAAILSSTRPILAGYRFIDQSGQPVTRQLLPPTTELWGASGALSLAALQDDTNVEVTDAAGMSAVYVLGRGEQIAVQTQAEGAVQLSADKPIAAWGETVSLPLSNQAALGYGFVVPVPARAIRIICPEPDTQVAYQEVDGTSELHVCSGSPGHVLITPADGDSYLPAGARVQASKPVLALLQSAGPQPRWLPLLGDFLAGLFRPILAAPAPATNLSPITLSGFSPSPNGQVRLYVNDSPAATVQAALFQFTAEVPLEQGENIIYAVSVNSAGEEGPASEPVTVDLDSVPPTITVTRPSDGANVTQSPVLVEGQVDEPATVTIDGSSVMVDPQGGFAQSVDVSEGLNTISVVAVDNAGNSAELQISVTYDSAPPLPPVAAGGLEVSVNQGVVTVTAPAGSVESGQTVAVTNLRTGETWTGAPAADGGFVAQVAGSVGDGLSISVSDESGAQSAPTNVQVREPEPAQASAVGASEGIFEVDPSGAATYSLALDVPPGTAGLAPELSLSYHSRAKNGPLGMGWSLAGLSRVTRCARTLAQDGAVSGVAFDADAYCLDGQRLQEVTAGVSCQDGAGGVEYRIERETYTRVLACGAQGDGPRHFEAWTKSGRIMTYGGTADARAEVKNGDTVRQWALSRIEDRSGNYLTVSYFEDKALGIHRPVQIDYTGNDAIAAPHSRVMFEYEDRPDVVRQYLAGTPVRVDKRLVSISTYTEGAEVREYRLTYDNAGAAGRSRLTSVSECAGDGTCLAPTRFEWSTVTPGFVRDDGWAAPQAGALLSDNGRDGGLRVADLNGDGRLDLILARRMKDGSRQHRAYLNNGQGFSRDDGWTVPGQGAHFAIGGEEIPGTTDLGLRLADLNGDGRSDLLEARVRINNSGSGSYHFHSYSNTGSGFSQTDAWAMPDTSGGFVVELTTPTQQLGLDGGMRLTDLNGDGLVDLLVALKGNVGSTFAAYRNTGSGFVRDDRWRVPGAASVFVKNTKSITFSGNTIIISQGGVLNEDGGLRILDLNGDGLPDLLDANAETGRKAYINSGTGFVARNEWLFSGEGYFVRDGDDGGLRSVDLNGDGLPDLLHAEMLDGVAGKGAWINTGAGFVADPAWQVPGASYFVRDGHDAGLRLVDVNGDDLPDLIHLERLADGTDVTRVLINTGAGFAESAEWQGLQDARFAIEGKYAGLQVVDLNGDGLSDLLLAAAGADLYGAETHRAYLNGSNPPDQLVRIEAGLGAEVQITYKPLTEPSVYTPAGASAYPDPMVTGPAYVVAEDHTSNGLGGLNRRSYRYTAGRMNMRGRGFLGFSSIRRTDHVRGTVTTTTYKQSFPFVGMVERVVTQAAGKTLRQLDNTWERLPADCTEVCFPALTEAVEQRFEVDGAMVSTTTTAFTYDDYGNRLTVTETIAGGGSTFVKQVARSYDNRVASWMLGLLLSEAVTQTLPDGTATTRTRALQYDGATGLVTKETLEPDCAEGPCADLYRETRYEYDAAGNRISQTVQGSSAAAHPMAPRTTLTEYDEIRRFPVSRTNAEGHVEAYTFDARFGEPARLVDANGLVTERSYDGFGRLRLERRPDGTRLERFYAWGKGDLACAANAVYYRSDVETGQAPITTYHDALDQGVCTESLGGSGRRIVQPVTYDALGRVVGEARPAFRDDPLYWTERSYDVLDRVLEERRPDGGLTCHAYAPLSVTDTRSDGQSCASGESYHQVTRRDFSARGALIRLQDAEGAVTAYGYGPFGELVQIRHPDSDIFTRLTYDRLGRRIALHDPDLGVWNFAYNAAGEEVWRRDAKGQETESVYDRLGRLIRRIDDAGAPEPGARTSVWTYDSAEHGIGRLGLLQGPNGYERRHRYDALGRPRERLTHYGGQSYREAMGYDGAGRVDHLAYPGGFAIERRYDAAGRLEALAEADSGFVYWRVEGRNAAAQVIDVALGNGLHTARDYDPASGRLEALRTEAFMGARLQDASYRWDALGNLRERVDALGAQSEVFAYDGLNRLTESVVDAAVAVNYGYDALGNLTAKSDHGAHYDYGGASGGPHAVSAVRDAGGAVLASYTYDANGNLMGGDGLTLAYTAYNKPHRIERAGVRADFGYDPERRRLVQVLSEADGGSTTTTLYIGRGYERVIRGAELSHRYHVYAEGQLVLVRRVGSDGGEALRYVHRDHLGSTEVLSDEAGAEVERLSFGAFGARRLADWRSPGEPAALGWVKRGYTGHLELEALGLIDMGARIYEPRLGRFLSADTVVPEPGAPQSLNRYSYVNNNPLSLTDPSGHFPVTPGPAPMGLDEGTLSDYGAGGGLFLFDPLATGLLMGPEAAVLLELGLSGGGGGVGYGLEGLAGLSDNARLVQAPVPGALGDGLLSEAPRGFGGARLELLAPDIEPDAGGDWLWLTGAAALDVGLAFVPGSGLGDVFQSYQSGNYLMAGLLLSLELPGGKVFKGTFTILGKLAPVVGGATRGGSTSLFRAVSKAELDDVAQFGFRPKPGGGSLETKLFATSADDAAAFGRDLFRLDRQPFTILETRIPNSLRGPAR